MIPKKNGTESFHCQNFQLVFSIAALNFGKFSKRSYAFVRQHGVNLNKDPVRATLSKRYIDSAGAWDTQLPCVLH